MKLLNRLKQIWEQGGFGSRRHDLRRVIWVSFTATTVGITLIMGLSIYGRYMAQVKETMREENQAFLSQAGYQLTAHLRNAMKVSDTIYYSVLQGADLTEAPVSEAFQLLCDTNKDSIERITLFTTSGELLETVPAAKRRTAISITEQEWYLPTLEQGEEITFGKPQVERLFKKTFGEYTRSIPMTRVVQLERNGKQEEGILLIQLKLSSIKDVFSNILMGGNSYLYLTDADGTILYHPHQELLESGYETPEAVDLQALEEKGFLQADAEREYYLKTISNTGWRIIGVVQNEGISLNSFKSGLLALFIALFFCSVMVLINLYLSRKLSAPLQNLEEAVNQIEAGNLDTKIEPSGFYEVWHLGNAINEMQDTLKQLMQDIVQEHEAKRRSELMVLQNQINPHFLYNTLDIIVWMIENEKREEAVDVVTALARFFRISLSKGKTIIPIGDEIEHVRNYLMIQEMRFKNRFTYTFQIEEDTERYGTVKLILQPIVENCIYHAMEFMDGDGEISVSVQKDGTDILFTISDNGCGMTEDILERLLAGESVSKGKGGVGLQNVQERLQLVFGEKFQFSLFSEPDEGTTVCIRIPAILYEELAERGLD